MRNFCIIDSDFENQMLERSEIFLTQTKKFLDNWVELGHDTCHRTYGYDVEQCHQDCRDLEKSDFAEQCRKDGGLFKCCIRYRQKCQIGALIHKQS